MNINTTHCDLFLAEKLVYEPLGLFIQNVRLEKESADYGAAEFEIDKFKIKFRTAKITPTKIGQFVTFWKRMGKGPILPYDVDDLFDFLIVSVRSGNRFGQFVFPKNVLCENGLVSKLQIGGKRAMRVYPPWDQVDNSLAKKTQIWQTRYFFEIPKEKAMFIKLLSFVLQGR